MITLLYDHSFEGLLTALFEVYEFKYQNVQIRKKDLYKPQMFFEVNVVITDAKKSERVLNKLEHIIGKEGIRVLLYSFLSEEEGVEDCILQTVQYILSSQKNVMIDYGNEHVLKLSKLTKSVGREKHRMEAFVRFELLNDGIYFAIIDPDFDVLMLIMRHFKNRYQDQKWIIYDIRRNYGVFYDLNDVEIIHFDNPINSTTYKDKLDVIEKNYQVLWKEYFEHTNIVERKNTKLHVQHVPKRYWKYLVEKSF